MAPPKRRPGARPAKPKAARPGQPGQRSSPKAAPKGNSRGSRNGGSSASPKRGSTSGRNGGVKLAQERSDRAGREERGQAAGAATGSRARPLVMGATVGPTPVLGRVAGLVAAAGALLLAVSGFTTHLVVSGQSVAPPTDVLTVVVTLLWPLAVLGFAGCLITGRWARAGFAGVVGAGLLSLGELVLDVYTLSDERAHPGYEVFFGERLLTTSIEPALGAWLLPAGHAALGLALLLLLLPGARPPADEDVSFDGSRPLLGGMAMFGGGLALVALVAAPITVPDRTVTDPGTGLQVPAPVPGTIAVLDRTGLALAGGILLALAAATAVCLAPLMRPRQASVALFGVVAVFLGSRGLLAGLDAGRSEDVVLAFGTGALLVAAAYLAGLGVLAGRVRRPLEPPAHVRLIDAADSEPDATELRRV